jgi:hypothetical protein
MERAVIFYPNGDESILQLALAHCRRRHLTVDSIATTWEQAIQVTRGGWAQVLVVGTRGDLDPRRQPRWEIADEWPDNPPIMERRPRRQSPAVAPPRPSSDLG